MRAKLIAVLVAAAAACVVAAPASGRDPNAAKIAVLQKQVKALQAEVRDLRRQLDLNYEGDTCLSAQTADLLQGTWLAIDQALSRTIFGAQSPVQDYGNCANLTRPDVPRPGIANPPRIDPFRALLEWLHVPLG